MSPSGSCVNNTCSPVLRQSLPNRRSKSLWPTAFVLLGGLLAAVYFVQHAVYGTHGLLAQNRLIDRAEYLQREVALLEAVRRRLRQDIAALSSEPPGSDVTESIARALLGYTKSSDIIVVDRK